ncbi:O-antigen ligase family protein [Gottfriedia acidiceleris]|uniref:O-antigen ligase family protein n=1 Tax=Gottfriedia acidiceleris TaxID=371036 RepID=UPI000B44AC3C|nr:O-antigen ligase family protein [Gottfriedia acidiceleris]
MINILKKDNFSKFINLLLILWAIVISAISATYDTKIILAIAMIGLFFLVLYFPYYTLIILILLNEKLFYFVSDNPFHIYIFGVIIFALFVCLIKRKFSKMQFSFQILFLVLWVILEIINANIIISQPITKGIIGILMFFKYLLYFYFMLYFNAKSISRVKDILINTGIIAAIIYIAQAIVYPKIIFLDVIFSIRDGNVRFYEGMSLVIFSLFMYLDSWLKGNKKGISNILYLSIYVVYFLFVCNTRNVNIALIGTIIIIWIINSDFRTKAKKIVVGLAVFLILVGISISLNYINFQSSVIDEIAHGTGSIGFRFQEINYYLQKFLEKPLMGWGIYNDSYIDSYYLLGRDKGYYTGDIGILGFAFQVGIFGILLFLSFIFYISRRVAVNEKCNKKNYIYIWLMIIFILLSLPSGFYLQDSSTILYIVLFLVIFEKESVFDLEQGDKNV